MRTDPDGVDRLVHVGCLVKWNAWIRSICHVCRKGDIAGDRVGQFIGKAGRDVYLHQACWPVWSGKKLVQISDLPEKERRLVERAFGIINEEQERK